MGTIEVCHIIGGGHDDVALGILWPGVPVHRSVESREFSRKEVSGGRDVLECWSEVDWVAGVGHDLLEFDFPTVVDRILAKCVRRCTTLDGVSRHACTGGSTGKYLTLKVETKGSPMHTRQSNT